MLGRNRIKKIDRLFNIKFKVYSDFSKYKFGYVAYSTTNITIYFYTRQVCFSLVQKKPNFFKCKKFNQVLQLIHEHLYDSRDNNKG